MKMEVSNWVSGEYLWLVFRWRGREPLHRASQEAECSFFLSLEVKDRLSQKGLGGTIEENG